MTYEMKKITPINNLTKSEMKAVNTAISQANNSMFCPSLRLGACIRYQGKDRLRR